MENDFVMNNGTHVTAGKGMYYNGNIAVRLFQQGMPYATITVNIDDNLGKNEAYLDTNNIPWIEQWVQDNGIAEPLGKNATSGYCTYPLYKFTSEFIDSIDEM